MTKARLDKRRAQLINEELDLLDEQQRDLESQIKVSDPPSAKLLEYTMVVVRQAYGLAHDLLTITKDPKFNQRWDGRFLGSHRRIWKNPLSAKSPIETPWRGDLDNDKIIRLSQIKGISIVKTINEHFHDIPKSGSTMWRK